MFNIFKRKTSREAIESLDQANSEKYLVHLNSLSDEELLNEYNSSLKEYSEQIVHKWKLTPEEYYDATFISPIRADLHTLVIILKKRTILFNVEQLLKQDTKWQQHLLERIALDFDNNDRYSKVDEAKDWWWQIDVLDKLDKDQLSRV